MPLHSVEELSTYLKSNQPLEGAINMIKEGIDIHTPEAREKFVELINHYRHTPYQSLYEQGITYLKAHPLTESYPKAHLVEEVEHFLANSNYYHKDTIVKAISMISKGTCVTSEAAAEKLLDLGLDYSTEDNINLFIAIVKNLNLCGYWNHDLFERAFYHHNDAILEYLEKHYPLEVKKAKYDQLVDYILEASSMDEIYEYLAKRHLDLGWDNSYVIRKLIELNDEHMVRTLLSEDFEEFFSTPPNKEVLLLCAVKADDPDIALFFLEDCGINPSVVTQAMPYNKIPPHVRKLLREYDYLPQEYITGNEGAGFRG